MADGIDIAGLVTDPIWPERNQRNPVETASPTASDPLAKWKANESIAGYLNWAAENNLVATQAVTQDYNAMLAAPEIAATIKDSEVTAMVMENLYGPSWGNPDLAFKDKNISEMESQGYAFFQREGSEAVNAALLESMSYLSQGQQEALMADAVQYYKDNSVQTAEDEVNFIIWISGRTSSAWEWDKSNEGIFGRTAAGIDAPGRFLRNELSQAWAASRTGEDAWYRSKMSLGTNLAVSSGAEAGTVRYETQSGIMDGVANIVIDPISWTANFAAGLQLAKTVPLAKGLSKGTAIRKALVPIKGGRALNLPLFSRGISSRMGFLFGAKHLDDMLTNTKNGKNLVKWLTAADNSSVILDRIPEWSKAVGTADALAKADTEDEVIKILGWAFEGGFDEASPMYKALDDSVRDSAAVVDRMLMDQGKAVRATGEVTDPGTARRMADMAGRFGPEAGDVVASGDGFVIRKSGDFYAAFVDETPVGGLSVREKSFGVLEEHREKGIGSALLGAAAKDNPDVSLEGIPITAQAARRLNSQTTITVGDLGSAGIGGPMLKEGPLGYTIIIEPLAELEQGDLVYQLPRNAKVLNLNTQKQINKFQKWLVENYKWDGSGDIRDAAKVYANAMGKDAIAMEDEILLLDETSLFAAKFDDVGGMSDETAGAVANYLDAKNKFNQFRRGRNTAAYVIKDMPTGKFAFDGDEAISKPKWNTGTSNAGGWWKRTIKNRFFGQIPEAKISIANASDGARQLKRLLSYIGVPHDDILRMEQQFLSVDYADRFQTILDIMTEAGEIIEHPLLRHNLIEFFRREGITSFGRMNGEEVLTTASRSNLGASSPRPFLPNMMKTEIPVPDPKELVSQLRRYKWAKSAGPSWNAGLLKGTQDNRRAIVEALKVRLGKRASAFSDEELLAMAYASVGDTGIENEALGAVAKFRNTGSSAWKGLVSVFSIAQLAGRFLPWFGRVTLDEQARGAFANLPSIMRSPVRYLTQNLDAYHLGKSNEYRAFNLQWAEDTMRTIRNIEDPAKKLERIREIIPNFAQLIEAEELDQLITNPNKLNRVASRLLNEAALKNDFGEIVGGVSARRQRVYQRAIDIASEVGIDITRESGGFTWQDDVPEILNRGWANMYGLQHRVEPVQFVPGNMTPAASDAYAHVWLNNLQFAASDPLARYAMQMMADDMAQTYDPVRAAGVINSSGWDKVAVYARQWASENGMEGLDEIDLLDQFVHQKIAPYVRTLFGDFLDADDINDDIRFLREIATTGRSTVDGQTYNFRNGSQGLSALQTRAAQANDTGRELPELLSFMNPHNLMDEPEVNYWNRAKELPNKIIGFWGDEMSQKTNRRAAWLSEFRREKAMRMQLGMNEHAATNMAKIKASETVNNVYYNLESVTPFLKNMNYVVPFFTAAYEITSTWAWKIPMMQGGMGIGHAAMIRRIDRVMDALRELGLVRYDENGQPTLYLDAEASSGNPFKDALSKGGANTIRFPLMFAEHMMNLGHALTDGATDIEREDGIVPDRFTFSVSNPIDIEHYGIGSALDVSLSAQPVLQFALSELRQKIPAIASHKTMEVSGTLKEIGEEQSVDTARLIAYNVDVLREELGAETLNLVITGAIPPSELDLTGIELRMPNSSMWSAMTDELFFPFGDLNSPGEVFTSFQPTWVKYVWRGLGLWQGGNAEDGFLGIEHNNVNKAAVAGQVISSLRHLQATEGVQEKMDQYRDEFYALAQPYLDTDKLAVVDGELRWDGGVPPDSTEVNAAWATFKTYSDNVLLRAIENAASTTMMRGMLAAVLPGNPRLFYEEEKAVDAYYAAMARSKGQETKPADIQSTVEYINKWIEDPTGGSAMALFAENHPELKLYLQGKSYWGIGGQPPLERSLELYFQDVEDGLRQPYPPDVYMHKAALANVQTEREVAITEAFGNDPYRAAAASIADPQRYREITEEFNTKREMLEWEDELNGSPYRNWVERNREDNFDIIAEAQQKYEDFEGTVQDIIAFAEADPNMNIDEVKSIVGELKGLKAGISDIREELENSDSDTSWMRPMQRLRLQYFDEVYGPYLDLLSIHYEALDRADTSEQQDVIWNKIAQVQDGLGKQPVYLNGNRFVEFPAPTTFQYNNKDPQIRERDMLQQTTYKVEWLTADSVDRLIARTPELEKYLPSTPLERQIIDEYNSWLETIDRRYNNGTGDITYKEYNDQKKNMTEQLKNLFYENGSPGVVQWMELWPVQKLYVANQLPQSIVDSGFVQQAAAIQQQRAADGYVSVGEDDEGRAALTRSIWKKVETDAQFAEDLRELGISLFGEGLIDNIIPELFFNDRF